MTTKALNHVKKVESVEDLFESTRTFKNVDVPWTDIFNHEEGMCKLDWEIFIGVSKIGLSYIRAEHRYIKDLIVKGEHWDFRCLIIDDVVGENISSVEPLEIEINSNLKTAVIHYGHK